MYLLLSCTSCYHVPPLANMYLNLANMYLNHANMYLNHANMYLNHANMYLNLAVYLNLASMYCMLTRMYLNLANIHVPHTYTYLNLANMYRMLTCISVILTCTSVLLTCTSIILTYTSCSTTHANTHIRTDVFNQYIHNPSRFAVMIKFIMLLLVATQLCSGYQVYIDTAALEEYFTETPHFDYVQGKRLCS